MSESALAMMDCVWTPDPTAVECTRANRSGRLEVECIP